MNRRTIVAAAVIAALVCGALGNWWKRRAARRAATAGPLTASNTDTFTYSNGALATVSSGVWVTQTGAASQFNVASPRPAQLPQYRGNFTVDEWDALRAATPEEPT